MLPISNPANLVVFRTRMPPLVHWLAAFTLPSVLSIAATYLVLRWYFRRDLAGAVADGDGIGRLNPAGKLVFIGIWIVAGSSAGGFRFE